MKPAVRKLALTTHVIASVGWLGAVGAYLALAIAGLASGDTPSARAAYVAMEMIGWYAIVPASVAALASGLVQALGTEWGLFRHYWVLTKLALTILGSIVLLMHMRAVERMAHAAHATAAFGADLAHLRVQLVVHAVAGLLLLIAATTLSIFKPWGKRARS
jgi:hypothetical protein